MWPPIYQVNSFTARPFSGNPAGVCVLTGRKSDRWMQNVAREMNVSETAFLREQDDGYSLRWFTPTVEVELCGHATLAAAHVLWEIGRLKRTDPARFHTRSGLLTAVRDGAWIRMDFPAEPEEEADPPEGLADALGVNPVYVGRNRFDYLVQVETEREIREMQPDFVRLGAIPSRGFIVTSRSRSREFDFVSRFFAPAVGVPEDPVTGSAHCCLGPFWEKRLGKSKLSSFQASARTGVVLVETAGERVIIAGQAVTILKGEIIEIGAGK